MKPTRIVQALVEELKEAGIITYNKEFLPLIGLTVTPKRIKSLSDYMRRDAEIRDRSFLKKIEACFRFDKEIWQRSDAYQSMRIRNAVEHMLEQNTLANRDGLDISDIIRSKSTVTDEQSEMLERFSNLLASDEAEAFIDMLLQKGFLEKKIENQAFLVELLKLTYQKGLYAVIVEFILPNLYRRYQLLPDVQKIEAHTLGSLGKYEDAKHILETLSHHTMIENINLRTSALSNHKRAMMLDKEAIDPDALYRLVQGYAELHAHKKVYSYYTGINLLYMVVLGQMLFDDNTRFRAFDTKAIYERSKPSLKTDKTHEAYYTHMSEFEFWLLLGRAGVTEKIERFLAYDEPHPSLVERTLRQMKLFRDKTAAVHNIVTENFDEAIAILQSYLDQFALK